MPILLITGAGRGIGAATATLAAGRGYDVAVNFKSDAQSAATVVEAVKIASLDKPTALAFGTDGALYVTLIGTAEEGAEKPAGQLVRVMGDF